MFETSTLSTNWRCNSAKVLVESQTSRASARLRTCRSCGWLSERSSCSIKVHNAGELCRIRVSMGVFTVGTSGLGVPEPAQEYPMLNHYGFFARLQLITKFIDSMGVIKDDADGSIRRDFDR